MANAICQCGNSCANSYRVCNPCLYAQKPRVPCAQCGGQTGYVVGKTNNPSSPMCRACKYKTKPGDNCILTDCDKTASHKGMCRKHYAAWSYRQPPASAADICSVDDCSRRRQARGMCITHWSAWRRSRPGYVRKRQLNRRERKVDIKCEWCGDTASVNASAAKVQRYCSLKCHGRANNSTRTRDEWRQIDERRPVIYTGPPYERSPRNINPIRQSDRRFKSGQCRACLTWFTSLNNDLTCSTECWKVEQRNTRRVNKNKRRALKRQAFVANVYRKKIFERDKYRCQLKLPGCQGVDKNKVVPHRRAPTEDHIIPLNKGGKHEPANVHTACFHCNCHKSDRGGGEQLALIG